MRALVVGCGRSGLAAAELLVARGDDVRLFDRSPELRGLPERLGACPRFLGADMAPDEAFAALDLMVLSPGVPPGPWRERAAALAPDAMIHGELSLALEAIARTWPGGAELPTVLVTGTNGKSTVTALTGALLEHAGLAPFVGGNLGIPLSEIVVEVAEGRRAQPETLVLECSSYQLETLRVGPRWSPEIRVAMLLNVTPDHLDRYASIDDYAETKARVFYGLGVQSLALLGAGDPFTPRLRQRVPQVAETVLIEGEAPPRLSDAGDLELAPSQVIPRDALALVGRHNAVNALFAVSAALHFGIPLDACAEVLSSFTALPHRMQPVGERGGVAYIDDSKATNVASVLAGLEGFERPFVLICGGQAKQGDDIGALRPVLERSGRGVVAIGESAELFLGMAEGAVPCVRAEDMHAAVREATKLARPGDAVLLSPACASWDMYRSYAHRGEVFAEAVAALGEPA